MGVVGKWKVVEGSGEARGKSVMGVSESGNEGYGKMKVKG